MKDEKNCIDLKYKQLDTKGNGENDIILRTRVEEKVGIWTETNNEFENDFEFQRLFKKYNRE